MVVYITECPARGFITFLEYMLQIGYVVLPFDPYLPERNFIKIFATELISVLHI